MSTSCSYNFYCWLFPNHLSCCGISYISTHSTWKFTPVQNKCYTRILNSIIPEWTLTHSCRQCLGFPAGISSKDVQPTVPVPPYPAVQTQAPVGQLQPLIYDRGLMEAVTNAQNFIAQTFPGARLLESHNVSFLSVWKILHEGGLFGRTFWLRLHFYVFQLPCDQLFIIWTVTDKKPWFPWKYWSWTFSLFISGSSSLPGGNRGFKLVLHLWTAWEKQSCSKYCGLQCQSDHTGAGKVCSNV